MAILTLKSGKALGREWGVYPFFQKKNIINWSHMLWFFVLFSTSHTYTALVTSSSFKSQAFEVNLFNLLEISVWLNSNLTKLANIFLEEIFPKGKKTKEHQHRDYNIAIRLLNYDSHITNIITHIKQNSQSFLKSVFVHHEIYLSRWLASWLAYTKL